MGKTATAIAHPLQMSMMDGDDFLPLAFIRSEPAADVVVALEVAQAASVPVPPAPPVFRNDAGIARPSTLAGMELELRARMGDDPKLCMAMIVASARCRSAGLPSMKPTGSIGEAKGPRAETHREMIADHQAECRRVVFEFAGVSPFTSPAEAVPALIQLPMQHLVVAFCSVMAQTACLGEGVEEMVEALRVMGLNE